MTIASFTTSPCASLSLSLAPPSNFTAPAFTIIPVDTVAITGSRVVIECLGHAHLEPELEWINIHGRRFPKGGGVLPTGALQFDPVTSEDAGTYRCHLSNSVGITYTQITLEVKGQSIDNIDYVTGIGNSSREQYIRAGQSVSH